MGLLTELGVLSQWWAGFRVAHRDYFGLAWKALTCTLTSKLPDDGRGTAS
jgi:hypothetical protein